MSTTKATTTPTVAHTTTPTVAHTTTPTVWVVTVPLALVKDTAGRTHHTYQGQPLRPDSAPEDIDRLAALGFIRAA